MSPRVAAHGCRRHSSPPTLEELLRKLPFASFIASLRSRRRRGSRAPRSSSRRRRAPAPTAACVRASPAPRRYHGRPPPPLPLAAACRHDWLRALDKHLDDVLRCSCRRSKLLVPPLEAGVAARRCSPLTSPPRVATRGGCTAIGGTAMQPPGLAAHFTLASDSVVSVPARWPMPPLSGASAQPERARAAMLLTARV